MTNSPAPDSLEEMSLNDAAMRVGVESKDELAGFMSAMVAESPNTFESFADDLASNGLPSTVEVPAPLVEGMPPIPGSDQLRIPVPEDGGSVDTFMNLAAGRKAGPNVMIGFLKANTLTGGMSDTESLVGLGFTRDGSSVEAARGASVDLSDVLSMVDDVRATTEKDGFDSAVAALTRSTLPYTPARKLADSIQSEHGREIGISMFAVDRDPMGLPDDVISQAQQVARGGTREVPFITPAGEGSDGFLVTRIDSDPDGQGQYGVGNVEFQSIPIGSGEAAS